MITISAFASSVLLASQQKTSPQLALASSLSCPIFDAGAVLIQLGLC